jgi:hypothetical protein
MITKKKDGVKMSEKEKIQVPPIPNKDRVTFDQILSTWAKDQGFEDWAKAHGAVLSNLSRWLGERACVDMRWSNYK